MKNDILIPLMNNAVLLLALATLYDLLTTRKQASGQNLLRKILSGIAMGLLGIGLILASVRLSPGIVFDTRSVLLSVSGLFFGTIPTVIAMAMTAAFRLWQGGAAACLGTCVIIATGSIGLIWSRLRRKPLEQIRVRELYLFGIVNHIVMLALIFILPFETAKYVLSRISGPVMLIYPVVTVALGLLLAGRLRRQKTAQALTESEATYRNIFQNNHAVMLLIDPSDGQIVDANPAAVRFYGWTADELRGMKISRINTLPPEEMHRNMQRAEKNQLNSFRFQHRLADGSVREIETLSGPVTIGGRKLLYSIIRDVTEQKRIDAERERLLSDAEQARHALLNVIEDEKQAEENLRCTQFALDHSADAVFWVEPEGGKFSYVNNSACRLLGYAEDELLKMSVSDIDRNFPAHRMDEVFKVLEQQETIDLESALTAKDGRVIPVEIHDSLIGFGKRKFICAFIHDITKRKKAAQILQRSEENLRITLNSIGDAVISTDTSGRIHSMNPVAEKLTGWTQAEASGQPLETVFRIVNEQTRQTVESPVANVLKTGHIIGLANHTLLIAKDGRETPIADSGAPIRNEHGETTGVVMVFRDQTEERKSQTVLEESRQKLESMFRAAPVGIGLTLSRVIREANARLCEMTGYAAEELIGQSARMLYPSQEEFERVGTEKYNQIRETGTGTVETVWQRKDGKRMDVLLSSSPLDHSDLSKGVTFTALDISENKRMQAAIEKRILALTRPLADTGKIAFEELFDLQEIQRIQDEFAAATGVASIITLPNGVPITQPSHFTRLCRDIIRKTEKGCSNCFTSDAAIGRHHPEGPVIQPCLSGGLWDAGVSISVGGQHVANWLIGQVRDETQTDAEMRAYAREIGADEEAFMNAFYQVPVMSQQHFEKIARALFTLANQLSLSAYQNMQQARFIAEERKNKEELSVLSAAVRQSPEAIIIRDVSGINLYVNPAYIRITGYSEEELIGNRVSLSYRGDDPPEFFENIHDTLLSGSPWTGLIKILRKDGEVRTLEAVMSPVKNSENKVTHFVAVQRDITEELNKEELFRQSQKMEAVGQLAGGVAHDFNNILQAVLGFSEILLNRLNPETQEHRNVQEIHKAAVRAADLTRQLLAFSRKQPVNKTELNLNTTIRDAEVLLSMLMGEITELRFELDPDLPPLQADHGQMTQIIMNLAVNARDAMPEGGRLTVTTETVTFEPRDLAVMPEASAGTFICLSVTDTGCGMSRQVKDHLFEPFFTTKTVGKGTGLGLAVIYGIVKQCEGWINVYSEEGHGSTIKIYLPAANPGGKGIRKSGSRSHSECILLVEDDKDVRQMVARILKTAGYQTVTAASAEEALTLFTDQPDRFDLLFSDMILPEKTGLELADTLRRQRPELPVLLYSGYMDQRDRWNDLESKGYCFTQKPFTMTGLLAAVHDTIQKPV